MQTNKRTQPSWYANYWRRKKDSWNLLLLFYSRVCCQTHPFNSNWCAPVAITAAERYSLVCLLLPCKTFKFKCGRGGGGSVCIPSEQGVMHCKVLKAVVLRWHMAVCSKVRFNVSTARQAGVSSYSGRRKHLLARPHRCAIFSLTNEATNRSWEFQAKR